MLYGFLKILFRITFRIYFRKVHVRNLEQIPEGPLIICSNHPSAFMDPIVIAALIRRRVFFLAKAEVFKGSLAKKMLPVLNMIPIYRAQDDPTQMHKNEETFSRCHEHLASGGAILIFPEGTSLTERRLRKIKTGAARIALGAEEKNNFSLGVHLLPVGLNYSNPHRFRQDLFIDIGQPIAVADYTGHYQTEGFAAAEALTEELRLRLEKQIVIVEDEDTDRLVAQIEKLYKFRLLQNLGVEGRDQPKEIELTRRIVETVNYYKETDPERVNRVRVSLDSYLQRIERLGLNDMLIAREDARWLRVQNILAALLIIIGAPLWLLGTIVNYLPFKIPVVLANKMVKHPNFYGSTIMAGGALLFLFWYGAMLTAGWMIFGKPLLVLAALVLLGMSGVFALFYFRRVKRISRRWMVEGIFSFRKQRLAQIRAQRDQIITEFDAAAKEFTDKFGSIRERWDGEKR